MLRKNSVQMTSTWVPTMEAAKKAGLIIGYKVFQASPKSPDQPNVYLEITFKNMAAYAGDIGDQANAFEAVTEKAICNSACQNQARVHRNEIRKVLGTQVTPEMQDRDAIDICLQGVTSPYDNSGCNQLEEGMVRN